MAMLVVTAHLVGDALCGKLSAHLVRIDSRVWIGDCSARVRAALTDAAAVACSTTVDARVTVAWQDGTSVQGVRVVHLGRASDTVTVDGIVMAFRRRS